MYDAIINIVVSQVYKSAQRDSILFMGSRRRTKIRPHRKSRSIDGRCPKCTTIVKFTVSGPVGDEIYECTGCTSKFHVDEL